MKKVFSVLICSMFLLSGCNLFNGGVQNINLFTIENDKELGKEVAAEIDNNPQEYPVLDSAQNPTPYKYLYDIRNTILNSGNVTHKDDFVWRLRIIKDDNTKNAFCTPGGYIYVYTGLIKYLDSEEQLAGVLAHEIGHADLRHSTRQMTKLYGVDVLLNIIAGDRALIKDLTSSIVGLKFSRTHETEADKASVTYLCPTDYAAAGGAKFFEKIEAEGGASTPEWLSTHPSPANRIEYFYEQANQQGCTGEETYTSRYQQLVRSLP
ncbi:M48 family metalloprotease [Brumimicrobium aurantiacum]|uniref:Peptidase M48 n=1 Tax=Brumimicrobium aurantiacum TaxID=1737063 RepID=A0A3E1EVK3_9FLAO|nr:M48 family metalloprotease [Brumimicrobium aurantiacum]RFC53577.1 peptidase M48 [Brumimicrobium aurantiacum]